MSPGVRLILILAGYVVLLNPLGCYLDSLITGWHKLAERFRFEGGTFRGTKWRFQTGHMRFYSHYGGCLTVGVDATGLYLSVWPILRIGQPALLIPWSEVTVLPEKTRFFSRVVELRLGREEQIPLRLTGKLVRKMQQAAGAPWPVETVAA